MFIDTLRDELWNLIRWKVEHEAWHSQCGAEVLQAVGSQAAEGLRALGYQVSPPRPNRTRDYYRDYVVRVSQSAHDAVFRWKVRECSMSEARRIFQKAAEMIAQCSPSQATGEDDADEAVVVRPAA